MVKVCITFLLWSTLRPLASQAYPHSDQEPAISKGLTTTTPLWRQNVVFLTKPLFYCSKLRLLATKPHIHCIRLTRASGIKLLSLWETVHHSTRSVLTRPQPRPHTTTGLLPQQRSSHISDTTLRLNFQNLEITVVI